MTPTGGAFDGFRREAIRMIIPLVPSTFAKVP